MTTTTRALIDDGAAALRATGIDTPRLDAELLLATAVGVDRTTVIAHSEAPVGADAEAAYRAAIDRRRQGEPIAYIRGLRAFHGIVLSVDARALIPRPETERLVDLAVAEVLRRMPAAVVRHPALRVVDVGTGSGAIAVALAVALRSRGVPPDGLEIMATDIASDALDLARENAVVHAVGDRVRFVAADLLPDADRAGWDVILANLPYIRTGDMAGLPAAVGFEPVLALDGGEDGLAVIDRLLDRLPYALLPGGIAILEIGADQGDSIVAHVGARVPGWAVRVETDLAGLPRLAIVERPA